MIYIFSPCGISAFCLKLFLSSSGTFFYLFQTCINQLERRALPPPVCRSWRMKSWNLSRRDVSLKTITNADMVIQGVWGQTWINKEGLGGENWKTYQAKAMVTLRESEKCKLRQSNQSKKKKTLQFCLCGIIYQCSTLWRMGVVLQMVAMSTSSESGGGGENSPQRVLVSFPVVT